MLDKYDFKVYNKGMIRQELYARKDDLGNNDVGGKKQVKN